MNTRKPGVDDSQNERHDIASINQFEPVSDGAHRDIDPVIPRIEPIVPRVETIEVSGVEVRPTPEMRPGATTIRKPHPPEPSERPLQNEVLFASPSSSSSSSSSTKPKTDTPKKPAIKADDADKSRMADEGGFDPPAWEARTTTETRARGLEHRARVVAIRLLERLEKGIHELVCRLEGPKADPNGGPSPR